MSTSNESNEKPLMSSLLQCVMYTGCILVIERRHVEEVKLKRLLAMVATRLGSFAFAFCFTFKNRTL
jgi:hypothetical protein